MEASGSGSGSEKSKSVANDYRINAKWAARMTKKLISIIKDVIREREEAHKLDKTFIYKLAERNLLERVKRPGFNIDEQIRKVNKELHSAHVAKQAFKVTEFDYAEFGVGSSSSDDE